MPFISIKPNVSHPSAIMVVVVAVCGCSNRFAPTDRGLQLQKKNSDAYTEAAQHQWAGWRGAVLHGAEQRRTSSPQVVSRACWDHRTGVRWRTHVPGEGNSSPVIWDDHIFLTTVIEGRDRDSIYLVCLDRETGTLNWKTRLQQTTGSTHTGNGYASSTVATDGRLVFVATGPAQMKSCDYDGNVVWETDLGDIDHPWGAAASPVVFQDLVIHVCDGEEDSFIVGLSKSDGEVAWKTLRHSDGSWTSPILVHVNDGQRSRFELVVNGTGRLDGGKGEVIAYDPYNGEMIWRVKGTSDIPCPTAIAGEGWIVSSSGPNGPVFAIRPGGEGDVTGTHVAWRRSSGGPQVPTGVIAQGLLFVLQDSGGLTCYDLESGNVHWSWQLPGRFTSSLIASGNRIYATNQRGDVYVFEAASKYRSLARNRLGEACNSTPAIANGDLYFRTENHLYCIASSAVDSVSHHQPAVRPSLTRSSASVNTSQQQGRLTPVSSTAHDKR